MNDSSSSSSRPPAGDPADAPVVSELGGPRPPTDPLRRVRRRWMGLIAAVVAALLAPQLLAAPNDAQSMALGWVALGGGLLLLGAARLAFDHLIAPELRAPELTAAEREGQGAAPGSAAPVPPVSPSEYLREVSRELRTTLHAVLSSAQLLSRSPLDASQLRQLRTIDGAGRALLCIVNDMLALSRPGRPGTELVPMGGSLHDTLRVGADLLQPAAHDRGLVLELRVAPDLPDRVLLDAGRVLQLVLGAGRHAIEASEHGTLSIDARPNAMTEGRLELSLRFEARGAAPSPAVEGLAGLALLEGLLVALGGSLARGDAPGTLELLLPLRRIDAGPGPRLRPPPEAAARALIQLPAASAPILVVDADEPSRLAAIELLENLGFEVEAASSASQAIERAAQKKFALILLDIELAGLEGYVAAARILTRLGHERPPLIGLSRSPLDQVRARAAAAGLDALLSKPIERESLCAALGEWLPDESNPASSGMRLSQAGALAQATERAQAAKLSQSPEGPAELQPSSRSASSNGRLAHELGRQYRALTRALEGGQYDAAPRLAAALGELCARAGAQQLVPHCHSLERAGELSVEQLRTALEALGRGLEGMLRQLGGPVEPSDSPPASATSDRNPERS